MKGKPEIITVDVRKEYPPNIDAIVKRFPQATKPGVVFAWGGIIYNPTNIVIEPWIAAHEGVHMEQQRALAGGPKVWWDRYLADKNFCLEQELPAHIAEYDQFCVSNPQRNARRLGRAYIAGRLAGPLYDYMIPTAQAVAFLRYGLCHAHGPEECHEKLHRCHMCPVRPHVVAEITEGKLGIADDIFA